MNLRRKVEGLFRKLLNDQPRRRDGDILRFVKSLSLDCIRCRGLSTPVKGTADRYRCTKCEKQFMGPPHQIDKAIWLAANLSAKQKADLKINYDAYGGRIQKPDDH